MPCVKDGIVTIRCIPDLFLGNISTFLFSSVVGVAIIYALYASWKFVISRGDIQKVAEAKKTLTYAIIGLVVVLLSYFILTTLSTVIGVKCLTSPGGCQ